ncbi:SAM-dependent methyltransferase [Streptosporangium nondiastaticum]|uniref:SAM-dependent methyltransferase n=2 Tax=Streptosporangium nondiastaticum TaxID=35764 RepID=A0A9X7PEG1_9ACTN|nr:SAM-dependent methyltransferase [Streptosporangium nondiastaticum]
MPSPVSAEVGALYDRFTALGSASLGENLHFGYWDSPDSRVPLEEATDRLTDMMADRLRIGAGSRVLDLGCGVGTPGVRIARRTGADVTGVSVSAEQIARANALAEASGVAERARFRQADAMELPFEDGSFDAVIALESIIHMPDRAQVLAHVGRVLRPGGRVVLTDFFERAPIPAAGQAAVRRYLHDFMMTMVTAESYPPLLRGAGLWLEEFLDISDQTLEKTFVLLSERISAAKQRLTEEFGEEMVDQFDPGDLVGIKEFGYLLLVARRP